MRLQDFTVHILNPRLYRACTQLKYQVPLVLICGAVLAYILGMPKSSLADLTSLDRSSFITYLGASVSLLALFCSLSIAWILVVTQQNKTERIATYDLLKARLFQANQWLLQLPPTEDTELCLSLIWELDKHEMADLPQTDRGEEYRAYEEALSEALDGEDEERRNFYMLTVAHFAYIEQLLNRIGMVSIRQVITRVFLDTLGKGLALIAVAVVTLVISSIWYGELIKPWLVVVGAVISFSAVLLLLEVFVDIRRMHSEDLDFIRPEEHDEDPS